MDIACPKCGKQFSVTSAMSRRTAKCANCGQSFRIPEIPDPSPDPVPAPVPVTHPSSTPSQSQVAQPSTSTPDDPWGDALDSLSDINTLDEENESGGSPLSNASSSRKKRRVKSKGNTQVLWITGFLLLGILLLLALCGGLLYSLASVFQHNKVQGEQSVAVVDDHELMAAINNNDTKRIKELVDNGANVNARTTLDNIPALHGAIIKENDEAALYLIEAGADVNPKTQYGVTPLDMANKHGKDRVRDLLRSYGAKSGD